MKTTPQKQQQQQQQQKQQQQFNKTIITNPGIVDRIEKDVVGFHLYGFSFERCVAVADRNHPLISYGRGILRSRALAPSTCTIAPPSSLSSPPNNIEPPYHLWVDIQTPSLIPTIGPFLRTLVRITDGVDPRTLRVVTSFHWKEETTDADAACPISSSKTIAAAAAKIAHHIHMIIRNSMGAALFLTSLSIVLPEGVAFEHVKEAMANNENVNYPTIRLVERHAVMDTFGMHQDYATAATLSTTISTKVGEGLSFPPVRVEDYLNSQRYDGTSFRFLVQTRMCTVRLTPILYQLARRLRGHSMLSLERPLDQNSLSNGRRPLLLACVDKVANLYRIILLARDYNVQYRLIIVVRNRAIRNKLAVETTRFITGLDKSENDLEEGHPRVETIDDTCTLLNSNPKCHGKIVAVDLHPNALTLDADGVDVDTIQDPMMALNLLTSCDALIWGFEKDGIPAKLDVLSNEYVQVRCRSSLNIVAAMSIVMHAYEPISRSRCAVVMKESEC